LNLKPHGRERGHVTTKLALFFACSLSILFLYIVLENWWLGDRAWAHATSPLDATSPHERHLQVGPTPYAPAAPCWPSRAARAGSAAWAASATLAQQPHGPLAVPWWPNHLWHISRTQKKSQMGDSNPRPQPLVGATPTTTPLEQMWSL
jgi:hypothetical protein